MSTRPTAFRTALLAASLIGGSFVSLGAWAGTDTPRVDRREQRQEARIDQGIASGQLTARETHRLDREQAHIQRAESHVKADGQVTARERARLERMQDRASADIRRQKHDRQQARKS